MLTVMIHINYYMYLLHIRNRYGRKLIPINRGIFEYHIHFKQININAK